MKKPYLLAVGVLLGAWLITFSILGGWQKLYRLIAWQKVHQANLIYQAKKKAEKKVIPSPKTEKTNNPTSPSVDQSNPPPLPLNQVPAPLPSTSAGSSVNPNNSDPQLQNKAPESANLRPTPTRSPEAPTVPAENKAKFIEYTVKSGDTWGKMAKSHYLTSDELRQANPQIEKLHPGDKIKIPDFLATWTKYSVQATDTWTNLAEKYQVDKLKLQQVNQFRLQGEIFVPPLK